ncbi:MAG: GH32 C-terminal domain-containing protein [Bacteroides sp.]
MKKVKTVGMSIAWFCLGTLMLHAQEQKGVTVEHLGTNNTLVRITEVGKYLLLPIQDNGEEATVNIVADGKQERSIVARLATQKVDYTVPLDLTLYRGKQVVLNVLTTQGRNSVREAKQDVCWKNFSVSDTYDVTNREKYRPAFHHTPLYGWMNDPNGMVYKDSVWHLCYQWNPYGSKWQNMTWGHSTSRDLIHWEHHQPTLLPDGLGTIFSGSAAIDHANSTGFDKDAVVAMYTSAAASQMQSLAYSTDGGYTFTTYPGNPVLTLESEARDPNMWWNEKQGEWNLVLAHALEKEMLFFTSPDMKKWTLQSSFGKGLGAQDGVWECPDLFELPVAGSNETKWVLLCNINPGGPFGGSATQYFVGQWDGRSFKADTDAQGNVPTKWMDYGKDHYATVSWSDGPDGRRTVIGWMSNWQYAAEVPTLQFRSANTLPREMGLFKDADGQYYISSTPSPELEALRGKRMQYIRQLNVGKRAHTVALPTQNDGICEILLEMDARHATNVTLTLSNKADETVTMTYDATKNELSFDRTRSGITDFSQDFPSVTVAPTHTADGKLNLRIFIDRSSIELFEQSGRLAMTNLVFPTTPYSTLSLQAEGGSARVNGLTIYALQPTF